MTSPLDTGSYDSDLVRVLRLEDLGNDAFRGPEMHTEVFHRTFGGHLVAQALEAATRTVSPEKLVHSLHAYFLAPADADRQTTYRVRRHRDGRSFASRSVEAFQGETCCFTMTASFHHDLDNGPEHAEPMPEVPAPEDVPVQRDLPTGVPGAEKDYREWDIRTIDPAVAVPDLTTVSGRSIWFKFRHELPDNDAVHASAFAYMSDMTILFSALQAHPGYEVQLASLDHAIWFLRPLRVDDWLLYRQASPSAASGRALAQGRIFNARGELVALVTQEGLARDLRAGATQVPVRDS